ncbi:MAG TPA: PVC-type heme-binding CxxCH protein, partial [Candidatus Saccharimonadia bacterium]|nr:PVC-type heme-binding CxxCH protein [Candidatus Saccharimonadia bacterium]
IVQKKGMMNLCIHPHGWIQASQMVEFIQYAHEKYGSRVKFLSMRDAGEKLAKLDISKHQQPSRKIPETPLPDGVTIVNAQGRDNGVRFVDLNGDGYNDIVFSNAERYGVYVYNPTEKKNVDWRLGWTFVMREGKAGDANSLPQIVRADGTNNGVWFKHGSMWVQNEDTDKLPGVVRRISYEELLKQPGPPPRSPEESLRALHVKKGFVAELVAQEPMVQDPIFIDWDEKGRMWVVEMADYPLGMDGNGKPGGRIKILEDTNRDGVYDKVSLFLDNLQNPTGLAPWKNGVFALAGGEIFFAADTDGDGKADLRETWYTGFNKGNSQHLANGFCWGLDGWFYGANGDSGGKVQSVKGGAVHDLSGRDFRFNPITREFQLQPGKTQSGRWRDDFGNWFGSNNSSLGWHYFMDERYLARNPKLAVPTLRRVLNTRDDNKRVFPVSAQMRRYNWPDAVNTLTSACNAMPYRDTLFGEAYANSIFVCEPANNLVHREVLEQDGISFRSRRPDDELEQEFLASEDPWFRPTMARTGPDGCLYVVDMYRLVLEHPEWIPKQMQAHMDLRAGEDKGRIYRVKPADLEEKRAYPWLGDDRLAWDPSSNVSMAYNLGSSNGWKADTAQRLLIEREATEAASILATWVEGAASDPPALPESANVRALWTLHMTNGLKASDLVVALRSPQPLTRAHAVRLSEQHLSNEGLLEVIFELAADPDPRVRLQVALTLGESSDSRIPPILRGLTRWNWEDKDMMAAVLSSVSKHATALAQDIPQWEAAMKLDVKKTGAPAPVIITNANPDRDKIVKQYANAAQLTGNPTTGHALYTNVCSACHRLKNEGTEIGPDLGMVAAKPVEQIIEAILDPNRAVEARYTTQTIATKQGRDVIGLVIEETPNSLTVRTAIGLETILRADIAKRSGNTKSLMPEGLETLLTPQHVADILAWIRQK